MLTHPPSEGFAQRRGDIERHSGGLSGFGAGVQDAQTVESVTHRVPYVLVDDSQSFIKLEDALSEYGVAAAVCYDCLRGQGLRLDGKYTVPSRIETPTMRVVQANSPIDSC